MGDETAKKAEQTSAAAERSGARDERPPLPGSGVRPRSFGYALRFRGRDLELQKDRLVIGRSTGCDISLDNPLVSRRHAELNISEGGVTVSDLGSRNGVLVNGAPIEGVRLLRMGDQLSVGDEQFQLVSRPSQSAPERENSDNFRRANTVSFEAVRPEQEAEDKTRQADAFTLLGTVVDKALALKRGDEAERLLAAHLERMLSEVEHKRPTDPELNEKAVAYAVRIANATRSARWVNYCFRYYRALQKPLPLQVTDQLYELVRKTQGVDKALIKGYLMDLYQRADTLSAAERFVLQRLEGLGRLAGISG